MVNALPWRDRLWLAPTQVARRRRRERDAKIGADAAVEKLSRQRAAINDDRILWNRTFDNLGSRPRGRKRPCDRESEQDDYAGMEEAPRQAR